MLWAVWKPSSIGLLLTDCYCLFIFCSSTGNSLLLIANSCEAICGPLTNSCYYCSVLMSFFLFVFFLSQLIRKKCKNKGNKGKNTHKKHKKTRIENNENAQKYFRLLLFHSNITFSRMCMCTNVSMSTFRNASTSGCFFYLLLLLL